MKLKTVPLSEPQKTLLLARTSVNLFLAGQGSGKTFIAGVVAARLVEKYPDLQGFIAANTHMQLTDSTLRGIMKAWELVGILPWDETEEEGDFVMDKIPPASFSTVGHHYRNYKHKICFKNGAVIYLGSLENYKAHDGKEFAWAILDETKDTREEAIKEVILGRLRQVGIYVNENGNYVKRKTAKTKALNPLFIFTSPAKVEWINNWFELNRFHQEIVTKIFSSDSFYSHELNDKTVVISSTYLNQAHLPENFIERMKQNLPSSLQDMLIYGSPFARTGGEFYKAFQREKHVMNVRERYNPTDTLHISFDFNVSPYMTLTIWQVFGNELSQLDELCLPSPKNTVFALCEAFRLKYSKQVGPVFVYGDPAGNQRNVLVAGSYYDLIAAELTGFQLKMCVRKTAPSVVQRAMFINKLLEEDLKDAPLLRFDEGCEHSIADYQFLKEDANGQKEKTKAKDKTTGISFEKYGHTSDANDYFLCAFLEKEFRAMYAKTTVSYRVGKGGLRGY